MYKDWTSIVDDPSPSTFASPQKKNNSPQDIPIFRSRVAYRRQLLGSAAREEMANSEGDSDDALLTSANADADGIGTVKQESQRPLVPTEKAL